MSERASWLEVTEVEVTHLWYITKLSRHIILTKLFP